MNQNQRAVLLHPWISYNKHHSQPLPFSLALNPQQQSTSEVILIAVLSIKPQTLSLLGKFALSQSQSNLQTLVYLSPVIPTANHDLSFQIAYLPYREGKNQNDCLQSMSDILIAFSEIIITDVTCNGPHKYKERRPSDFGEGKQFVIVNNKDLYQIEAREAKIQLTKKVQFLINNENFKIPELNTSPKSVRLDKVHKIFSEYTSQYSWFLNSDRNWKILSDLVITRYKREKHLQDCFGLQDGEYENKVFTCKQIKTIENELLSNKGEEKSDLSEWVNSIITNKLRKNNQSKVNDFLIELKAQFCQRSIQSEYQLHLFQEEARGILNQYSIPQAFISFLLSSHQQSFLQRQNEDLLEKQQILKQLVMQRNNQLVMKGHKIDQLKQMIAQFAEKAAEMKKNTQQLIDISQLYEEEKQKNWKLKLEVDSHLFIAKKNTENKIILQNQIQKMLEEKRDLLMSLQELTSQNLSLMTQRQSLRQEIKDMRDRLEDSNQIQARALKSIENEAEIKVRLSRYQNYVQELKQVFNSFKRMEIEKFNYILQHNYKEYEQLQEKYKFAQFELRRSQSRIKELSESIHCERVKLGYFQKMYVNSYQNEPIPEVSEENSATDREISQNA